jgi:ribosomal protein L11 methyltransferase
VVEATGLDEEYQPIPGKYRLVVKTYFKPGPRGQQIRQQIEEGLWRLSLIYPIPEPQIRTVREEDWAHAWKKFYKPLRIGRRVVLKPTWETYPTQPDDLVIELDPGMAFGTGLHPSTRLCIAALEETVQPGDRVLDLGTGSGVLALVAAKLGAGSILATDIDTLAVRVAEENATLNRIPLGDRLRIQQGSVPGSAAGQFQVIVANILAEVLVSLFAGAYGDPLLAEPLAPGGYLILAGILADRAHLVVEAAKQQGLRLVDRKEEGDWVALVVQK